MDLIEDCSFCRVIVRNRIFLFNSNRGYISGFCNELKGMGFDGEKYYKRPCDPSEIEAAYKLEGTHTSYKGVEFSITESFEPDEYVKEQNEEPNQFTPFINKFFEYDGQNILRLAFIFDPFTKMDFYSKYSYDKQRKNRISIFEYNMQRILRLEFGPNYNESIELKIAHKDTRQWGEFYLLDVLDDDIPDVWQIRKPVEGFPMLGEEKVYIKKDGVWLPRKEYGSRIDV